MSAIEKLQRRIPLSCDGGTADAFLLTSRVACRYYTSFSSSAGCILVTKNGAYFLTDFRYYEAARKTIRDMQVEQYQNRLEHLNRLFQKYGIKRVAMESNYTTISELFNFQKEFTGVEILSTGELDTVIRTQRITKSSEEIAYIKKAQAVTEAAYRHILGYIREGVSELDLALELEFFMRKNGASAVAFDLIVVSGPNSSMPHGVPGTRKLIPGDFITMDTGAVVCGYHSDMTRTVALGKVTEEQKKVYDIVLHAQQTALNTVKEGVQCSAVDAAARDVIKKEGYGNYFGHSTGHGVGLEIHEAPTVSYNNSLKLRKGMVITVEPGIYLPGKFGVRIEDMAEVTENSCNNLTNIPKELIIL